MKRIKVIYALVPILGLLLFASAARAQNGILGTKHNLSTSGTGTIHVTTATAEVCVFCHTPHGADTTAAAPLWNRALPTNTGYTMYSSPTYDATTDTSPSGVSQACLSCHDGTIAFDALRNLPGSGGYNPAAPSAGWTFTGNLTNNLMPAGIITNIGKDLSNDHPISMDYASAKSPSSLSGTNDHATGFKDPLGDVFSNGVRLYSGKVQCASCHDPHRADTPTFLRVANTGSALCLTCHRKDG